MREIESNNVVESKGVEVWLHPKVGGSFGSFVARSKREGHMERRECAYSVWAHHRYAQRERRAMRRMGKREPALCCHWSCSVQGRPGGKIGKAASKPDGGTAPEQKVGELADRGQIRSDSKQWLYVHTNGCASYSPVD